MTIVLAASLMSLMIFKRFQTQPKEILLHHIIAAMEKERVFPHLKTPTNCFQGRGGSRGRGGRGGSTHQPQRKENILDLSKYQDKQIRVRFTGGREGTPFAELT